MFWIATPERTLTSPFLIPRPRALRFMFRTASTLPPTSSSFTIRLIQPRHPLPLPNPRRASLLRPQRSRLPLPRRQNRNSPAFLSSRLVRMFGRDAISLRRGSNGRWTRWTLCLAFVLPWAYTLVSLCIGSHDGVGASPLFCWTGWVSGFVLANPDWGNAFRVCSCPGTKLVGVKPV